MALVGADDENDEGKAGKLSAAQRDDLAKFLLAVPYPPAQRRAYTNELSRRARKGFELFHISGDDDPTKIDHNVCGDCHRMPNWVSTNTPGTGMDAPTWRGAYDRWLILPQGRLNIIEFDFFRRVAEDGLDERRIWQFSWAGRRRFDPVWDMVLEGSTGLSGSYARQVTLNEVTAESELELDLLRALETSANEEAVALQIAGVFIDGDQSRSVLLQFDPHLEGGCYSIVENRQDTEQRKSFTREQLIGMGGSGRVCRDIHCPCGGDGRIRTSATCALDSGTYGTAARASGVSVFI